MDELHGERWFPLETRLEEDLPAYWGDWGVDSEIGRLRAVLLRRPGAEIEGDFRPEDVRWHERMDPELARAQQDRLADVYRAHGAQVYYVEHMRPDRPNALYMRDLVLMTPEGAIVGRPAIAARRGEERYAAEALARLGVPILKTISADGVFEGACVLWLDRKSVVLGTGARCNASGAEQVETELRRIGVQLVQRFQIPYGHAHIDGLMNIADRDVAAIFPMQVPYDVVRALKDRGFRVLEVPWIDEVKRGMSLNFVALEPGKVVMPAGNPRTRAVLEEAGVQVIEVDVSEIRKGWGAIHCMTVALRRDPI